MGRYVSLILFFSVLALVLYGVFRPTPPTMVFEHSDKVGHVLAFLALALTGRFAIYKLPGTVFWLVMLALAFLLEYMQGELRPLRVFSMGDVAANTMGVATALLVFVVWPKKTRKPVINELNKLL